MAIKKVHINESQYNRLLIEYHHAYGNGLDEDAENIAMIAMKKYKERLSNISPTRYHIKEFGITIYIRLVNGRVCACSNYGDFINVGIENIKEAIESNDIQRLASLIYHELGHLTNIVKSDYSRSETKEDFRVPLFLHLNDEEYRDMQIILYRFHDREMKARCFETTMFLKKNKNPNITIQDVYNDRCSDIAMMRGLIKMLEQGAEEGPESKYGKILNSLSHYTWENNARFNRYDRRVNGKYVDKIRWKLKCRNTINYFTRKYEWLKKRIDKIFYDYKVGEL